jgi:putative salt-induced outer membrane protein YdiY
VDSNSNAWFWGSPLGAVCGLEGCVGPVDIARGPCGTCYVRRLNAGDSTWHAKQILLIFASFLKKLFIQVPEMPPRFVKFLWVNSWLCLFLFGWTHASVGQVAYEMEEGVIVDEVAAPEWTGTFGSGLNGQSGNSESLDINMTLNLDRETDVSSTNIQANYFYGSNSIATVTDRAFAQFRQERKLVNDRWSMYFQGAWEIDQFKDYDYRVALHGGLAYVVFDEDFRKWKLRFGSGASKEVGGATEEWIPELQFGTDWERKLTETTKVFAIVDFYPNVSDFGDFRVNTNAGFNFLVDAERNINLRLFAMNRYDSTPPAGNNENDLDYGMALVVGF